MIARCRQIAFSKEIFETSRLKIKRNIKQMESRVNKNNVTETLVVEFDFRINLNLIEFKVTFYWK